MDFILFLQVLLKGKTWQEFLSMHVILTSCSILISPANLFLTLFCFFLSLVDSLPSCFLICLPYTENCISISPPLPPPCSHGRAHCLATPCLPGHVCHHCGIHHRQVWRPSPVCPFSATVQRNRRRRRSGLCQHCVLSVWWEGQHQGVWERNHQRVCRGGGDAWHISTTPKEGDVRVCCVKKRKNAFLYFSWERELISFYLCLSIHPEHAVQGKEIQYSLLFTFHFPHFPRKGRTGNFLVHSVSLWLLMLHTKQ